jgi:hypothetical protein
MDAPAESVAALLDEILESVAEGPRDREALRDLTGALRVLSLALPGFAAALRSRLSSLADQDCLASCIRAVLLERTAVAAPQPARVAGAGPQFPNLGTHYEKSR